MRKARAATLLNCAWITIIILLGACEPLFAQNAYHCPLEWKQTATVSKITNESAVVLEDGTEVRLLASLLPLPPAKQTSAENPAPGMRVLKTLRNLLQGRQVRLAFDRQKNDRYGRLLAHLLLVRGSERIWVQSYLVEHGLARVYSFPSNRACVPVLLERERAARRKGEGLWRLWAFKVRKAEATRNLLRSKNSFQIVEGFVRKVSVVRGRYFLNFDADWRKDFTVAIDKEDAQQLLSEGLRLEGLAGRRVRVRGWIEYWNGPIIKMTHREQLEIIGEKETKKRSTPRPKIKGPAISSSDPRDI